MASPNHATESRLREIDKELAELQEQRTQLRSHWEHEKNLIKGIRSQREEIEQLRLQAEQLERQGELARVAELRYGSIPATEADLKKKQDELERLQREKQMLKEVVGPEDIAEVVAKWTGIPVSKMLESEREKLLRMEDRLHDRIVGQDEAVTAVSNAIRRSRAGLQDRNRPIGSFIFLGSTGVGKTELARALAEFLFDDEHAMVRIDMSEYMEKFSVSRLIGAPPGYVGYEEGGQLTEAVRRRPYSVLLLDEIEKAHPDVFNILLQVLDDGRLTDSQGRTVDFKNAIVIMTSNIGSQLITKEMTHLTDENRDRLLADLRTKLMGELRKTIRPEFLNRIDDIVMFQPLTQADIRRIVDIQITRVAEMMQKSGIHLDVTTDARDWLAQSGFDPAYGARPLKRVIQRAVIDPMAMKMLSGEFLPGDSVRVDHTESGQYIFEKVSSTEGA
ncbi:MAG: AAA family ATPase [Bacteroidota bacterium]|nr:AAA family ATPase [Bacteroidota bacterium]MDP4232277.1 AAA family ATPase [Bacteroidota bacterium]MDP4241416.1 AAA family ATPase [Bacteroidota bacterium]MDP4286760.1 AAA family ATPase [Bacteroidota bacterium]